MTWQRTHDWWRAIREVEAALDNDTDTDPDGGLPWYDGYAELFGDREGLLLALEYRWSLLVSAQLDPDLPERERERTWRDLTARHAGLLRALARSYPAAQPADSRRHA